MKPSQRLNELIEDWNYLFRREGVLSAFPIVCLEIARLPYRHIKFFVLERLLTEPLPDLPSRIDLEIRPFDRSILELVEGINRPSEARQCARHLECGHQGLAALHQNQLAGYAWGCAEVNSRTEKVRIKLNPGDVLCTDVYTNPAFRNQGVQTALSLARFRLFRDLGFLKAICYIEVRNAPSLAVWQRKLGGQIVGKVDFLRIGPWYHMHYLNDNSEIEPLHGIPKRNNL